MQHPAQVGPVSPHPWVEDAKGLNIYAQRPFQHPPCCLQVAQVTQRLTQVVEVPGDIWVLLSKNLLVDRQRLLEVSLRPPSDLPCPAEQRQGLI